MFLLYVCTCHQHFTDLILILSSVLSVKHALLLLVFFNCMILQVRDEYRQGFDADRGGFGIHLQQGAMGPHPGMAPPGMAPPGMAPPGMAPSSEF